MSNDLTETSIKRLAHLEDRAAALESTLRALITAADRIADPAGWEDMDDLRRELRTAVDEGRRALRGGGE